MDKEKNRIDPIEDKELDPVTGGVSADALLWKQAELTAKADGRVINLKDGPLASAFCPCHHRYKWAKSDRAITNEYRTTRGYTDIKCYSCGKTNRGSIY